MVSSLMASLSKLKMSRRKVGLLIMSRAEDHESSSCSISLGFTSADGLRSLPKRMSTQSKMRLMISGGFLSCLSRPMSLGLMAESALCAASRAGCAASRSRSTASFWPAMMSASPASLSLTSCTSAFFFSARAVDAVISWSSTADFSWAMTRPFSFSLSSTFMRATSSPASTSLDKPVRMDEASMSMCCTFLTYTSAYASMKERYDLGVT
mmetsp:Transcript_2703/g.7734  ORF Transcript_2703/g.7734 Transcript_2703/m.7734 type:complete len:210 (+) Transcript_2703:4102-4731(+)